MTTGVVVTFYSYKGGVGRTLALANVAALLARWGHRVLCVDWDLEAPGLHLYFFCDHSDKPSRLGLVDWLTAHTKGTKPLWRDYVTNVPLQNTAGSLDVMTAGRPDEQYVALMQGLRWESLFAEHAMGRTLETLRNEWKENYDFVLVDSRTGVTDAGGICTIHLPDLLVLMSTANDQSIAGIRQVWQRAKEQRNKLPFDRSRLLALPVLTRFDARVEVDLSKTWLEKFIVAVQPMHDEWLVKDTPSTDVLKYTRVPYVAKWSYGERLPVMEESNDPDSISYAFETLAAFIVHQFANSDLLVANRDSFVSGARRLGTGRKQGQYAYDVFLDYSSPDGEFAESIATELQRRGFNVYLDKWNILPGSQVRGTLDNELAKSQHLVTIAGAYVDRRQQLLSKTFLDLTYEQTSALSANATSIVVPRKIIPVLRSGASRQSLPGLFGSLHMVEEDAQPRSMLVDAIVKAIDIQMPQEALAYVPPPRPLVGSDQWNVVISYRSVNRPWVLTLYDVLRQQGHKVFLDQVTLKPGDRLISDLQNALSNSQAGVLVWSAATGDSDWVQREYETLETLASDKRGFQFVPIKLDAAPVPPFVRNRIFLDFSSYPDGPNGGELLRLLHAVAGLPLSEAAATFATQQDEAAQDAGNKIGAAVMNRNPSRVIELFHQDGLAWKTSSALGCKAAQGLTELGRDEDAIVLLEAIEAQFPRAIRPQQLRALALARRGKGDDLAVAQEILGSLYAKGERDPETLGIYGRTWMDRYDKSHDVSDLQQSRNLYAQAFDAAPDDYYVGINAAAKSVFLGTDDDLKQAESYAARVQKIVGTEARADDYWWTATVGEVFLIRKMYQDAARLYGAAVSMARAKEGSHRTTWTQACRLMEKLQPAPEQRAMIRKVFEHLPDSEEKGRGNGGL